MPRSIKAMLTKIVMQAIMSGHVMDSPKKSQPMNTAISGTLS